MSSLEIQKIAMEVYNNKLNYKDNDYIVIMNLLKESYMKAKGILDEYKNEKEDDNHSDDDEEYGVRRYANYDSEDDSDEESYTSTYLSPY